MLTTTHLRLGNQIQVLEDEETNVVPFDEVSRE